MLLDTEEARLNKLLEAAAEKGAKEALRSIGLHDENAYGDMHEIRNLLESWRGTKRAIQVTVAKFLTTAILSALLAIFWMQNKGG
jgi:hypothetical protein